MIRALFTLVLSFVTSTAFAGDEAAISPTQPYPFYYMMLKKPDTGCKASQGCSSVTNATDGRMAVSFPQEGMGYTNTPVVDAKNVPLGAYIGEYTVRGTYTLPNGRVVPVIDGTLYTFIPNDLPAYFFRDGSEAVVVTALIGGGQTDSDPELVFDLRLGIPVRAEAGKHWIDARSNPMTIDGFRRPYLIVTTSSLHANR